MYPDRTGYEYSPLTLSHPYTHTHTHTLTYTHGAGNDLAKRPKCAAETREDRRRPDSPTDRLTDPHQVADS